MKKKVVDPSSAKNKEYRGVLEKIAAEGECPFCPGHFKYHKEEILFSGRRWCITKASWPYPNAAYHFLIIGKQHKEELAELFGDDFSEVKALLNRVIEKFGIKGGALTLRFGDTRYTGATVCHLHFHFIVPEIDSGTGKAKPVQFPVG